MGIIESFFGRGFGVSWPSEYVIGGGAPRCRQTSKGGSATVRLLICCSRTL
jgi:hypothetical protein